MNKEKSRVCRSESSDKAVKTIFSVSMTLSYTTMRRLFILHINETAGPLSGFVKAFVSIAPHVFVYL